MLNQSFYARKYVNIMLMCLALDITILRPFNVYGPDQEKHFLIPEIIEQIKKSKKIIVNSFQPKRDFYILKI